ncbi:MAG: glycosyltransferase [Massilia sp.]|nr:glycosyltransferase [Aquabacterium sp.]
MRVLWTLPYLPWPITSGGKARQYHLLRRMAARGHAITLLVQSKTPADEAVQQALQPLLERLIVVPRRSLRSPRTLWHAATSSAPLLASVNGFAPALSQQFDALLNEHWDVIQIEHSYGFQPFADSLARRGQPFILTEHNVESELGAATYGKWPAVLRPLAHYDQWRARRWEQRVMSRAAAIVAVTESDARMLGAISGRPAHVVNNGVDTRGFAQVQPDPLALAILFVGNYEYAPNVDAVEWAAAEIMPLVWRQRPQARFLVCGHALPDSWRQRFPDPRIEWRGYVDHLPTVQSQSTVFIAPLRFGGGSKLKVLEALAAGLPIVSTQEGLSGLGAQDGVHARVANTAADMAQALVEVMDDPALAARLGQSARELVNQRFDWDAAAAQLEAVYQTVQAVPA